jgi:hypothetical protein
VRESRGEELRLQRVAVDENAVPLAAAEDRGVGEIAISGSWLQNL